MKNTRKRCKRPCKKGCQTIKNYQTRLRNFALKATHEAKAVMKMPGKKGKKVKSTFIGQWNWALTLWKWGRHIPLQLVADEVERERERETERQRESDRMLVDIGLKYCEKSWV